MLGMRDDYVGALSAAFQSLRLLKNSATKKALERADKNKRLFASCDQTVE